MSTPATLSGAALVRYTLTRELRSGSLDTVYLAEDRESGRRVQLHLLRDSVVAALDPDRLLDALQHIAALRSRHVVPLIDAGRAGRSLYYAEAHIEGVTARDKLYAHGPAPLGETVRILRGVARALVDAHGLGLLHLGIDAGRILLADPDVVISGVGVIPALERAARGGADAVGRLLGPSEYRAPEQIEASSPVDHRADLYAVGLVGRELLTGRLPSASPSPVSEARPDVPPILVDVLDRCLAARPADRWESTAAMLERLDAVAAGSASADTRDRIGPYRTLGVRGEGGMGIVYLAEQIAPVRRHVALKLIKLGMDTKEVVARFEAERQALALLDHPGVAKVFDGGATASGRPYFVMELVDGLSLTEHADAHRLSVAQRLRLFVQVCEAVTHAHQKGIVHRDLKPDNVLVTRDDQGRSWPKVIDFGVAKAVGGNRLTERTLATLLGQMLGTPQYMSPEQAGPLSTDVDTRADVYALGVMLYELLAGALPLDPAALESAPDPAALIRESDPPTPSARYRSLGTARTAIAAARGMEVHALLKTLVGDLDWIAMRAIEKDRERRYQTVQELSQDLGRYLAHEPVTARPPSAVYRTRKFVRRHRLGVSVGAVLAVAIVGGLAATSLLMFRARRAEREAKRQADVSRSVSEFLVNLFRVSDPGEGRGAGVTARELLDKGARDIQSDSTMEPLVQARLLLEMGYAYRGLALYDEAADALDHSLALRTSALGERHRDVVAVLVELGILRLDQSRYVEAESVLTRAVATLDALGLTDSAAALPAANNLAVLYARQGRYDDAGGAFHRVIRALEVTDTTRMELAGSLSNLGIVYLWQGDYAGADSVLHRALRLREQRVGSDHPTVVDNLTNLGWLYTEQARYAQGDTVFRRGAEIAERVLGPDHPALARILNNHGSMLLDQARYAEAVPLLRRSLEIKERALGPRHVDLTSTISNLGVAQAGDGDLNQAEASQRRALELRQEGLGPSHPRLVETLDYLAEVHLAQQRLDDAERVLRRALAIAGAEHAMYGRTVAALAEVYARRGRTAEADSMFARGIAAEAVLPPTHPEMRRMLTRYGALLRRLGRPDDAAALEGRVSGAAPPR